MTSEGAEAEGQPHSKVALDLARKKSDPSRVTRRRLAAGVLVGTGVAVGLTLLGRQLGVDAAPIGAAGAGLSSMGAVVLPEALIPRRKMRTPASSPRPLKAPAEGGGLALPAWAGTASKAVAEAIPQPSSADLCHTAVLPMTMGSVLDVALLKDSAVTIAGVGNRE